MTWRAFYLSGQSRSSKKIYTGSSKKPRTRLVVLTVPGLEGDGIEDFSIRVADAWKIGQKGIANGVILVVAQKERMIRIEVGRGFEGILPDAIASRIIREAILPRYRTGDYAGSIAAGVDPS